MTLAIVSHPECLLHENFAEHPECPERLSAINDQLIASGLDAVIRHVDAPVVSEEHLCLAHSKAYVKDIFAKAPTDGHIYLDPDTLMTPHTLQAALRAAGAGVKAVDLLLEGQIKSAFCNVRPPGHHAGRDFAMGFCIFNNVAVAAAYALTQPDIARIAIVDFDVHHGNGTEDIFSQDTRVLLCSSFQHPFYPFSGHESHSAHMVMGLLPGGSGSDAFRQVVTQQWMPALNSFKPQMIFISAGFDAHIEDDMAHLKLTESDYFWVTQQIKQVADEYSQGRIVSLLEGGYALSALGRSVVAHLKALMGYPSL